MYRRCVRCVWYVRHFTDSFLVGSSDVIFEKDSIIYGFCAFSPNRRTVSINDLDNAKKIVKELNDTCDIVIVSFHGGAEGKEQTEDKKEQTEDKKEDSKKESK